MEKISIIMPAYNVEKFIKPAIQSLLKQSYKHFRLIIVNDASTDNTLKIAGQFSSKKVKIISNRINLGVAKSLNIGIRASESKYIARMDADDLSLPDRLEIQFNYLEKNSNCMLVGSWVDLVKESGKSLKIIKTPVDYKTIKKKIFRSNTFIHPTVMMRRSALEKLGAYDDNLNGAEDYDLFLRIAARNNCVNLPLVLLKYRLNKSAVSLKYMKKVEFQSLKARIKAICKYRYPFWQSIFLIKPLIMFFIPAGIKLHFYPLYE